MEAVQIKNFLYRQKVRLLHHTWPFPQLRRNIWRRAGVEHGVGTVYHREFDCFSRLTLDEIHDDRVAAALAPQTRKWIMQPDVIYRSSRPTYLEPVNSLGLLQPRTFIHETKCNAHAHLIPSPAQMLRLNTNRNASKLERAFLFDGYASKNLYHFIHDALNPLLMARQSGAIPADIPVVYNHRIGNTKWFEYFRGLEELRDVNWRVQEAGEWLQCGELYRSFATYDWWKHLYALMERRLAKTPTRNIFVERKNLHGRSFSNKEEVHEVLRRYDFEILLLDDLPYAEQVRIFSEAKNIASHHGAGLSNIVYAHAPSVGVLELFSSDYIMPHYYWLAQTLGFQRYTAASGGPFDINKNYRIDPGMLRGKVEFLLAR